MLLLGVTNGYWATLCMMFGPMVVEPQDSERAGSVMLLCLVIGLGASIALTCVVLCMGGIIALTCVVLCMGGIIVERSSFTHCHHDHHHHHKLSSISHVATAAANTTTTTTTTTTATTTWATTGAGSLVTHSLTCHHHHHHKRSFVSHVLTTTTTTTHVGAGSFLAFVVLAIACNCNSFIGEVVHQNTTLAPSAADFVSETASAMGWYN
jgi:hypothetical protein